MIECHLQTTFCDDIRHELGNKLSFIGIYSTSLIVPSFPFTLPKLCVFVKVVAPIEKPFESLTVRILKDGKIMQELVVDDESIAKSRDSILEIANDDKKDRAQVFQAMTAYSPMHFDGPCILRVHAQTEDKEIRGLGLKVEQSSTAGEP